MKHLLMVLFQMFFGLFLPFSLYAPSPGTTMGFQNTLEAMLVCHCSVVSKHTNEGSMPIVFVAHW